MSFNIIIKYFRNYYNNIYQLSKSRIVDGEPQIEIYFLEALCLCFRVEKTQEHRGAQDF